MSGQRLYIVDDDLSGGTSKGVPVKIQASEVVTLEIVVDLAQHRITASMKGRQVSAELPEEWRELGWIGYCIASVAADFSPIEIDRS